MKATQSRMCGVLITGRAGQEQAIPVTSVWKLAAYGPRHTTIYLNDATAEGRTGDYGRIETKREEIRVDVPLMEAVEAFRSASRGDVVDLSERARQSPARKTKVPL